MATEQQNLMRRLEIQSFALDDIRLYLDTHPTDQNALEYYNKYKHLREQTLAAYTSRYGPLDFYDADVTDRWTWVDTPWPWEGTV